MKTFLVLHFQAPFMYFGGLSVDNYGGIRPFPPLSMITGLLANALGWTHKDGLMLNRLQERLLLASRIDQQGKVIVDFQTVDFSQDFFNETGWTTYGYREDRTGGFSEETHIRYRSYYADCACTVVFTLSPDQEYPTVAEIEKALEKPQRPLFLGRKCCLPATLLKLGKMETPFLLDALRQACPVLQDEVSAQLPASEAKGLQTGTIFPLSDLRDWVNQVHTGERLVWEGKIRLKNE